MYAGDSSLQIIRPEAASLRLLEPPWKPSRQAPAAAPGQLGGRRCSCIALPDRLFGDCTSGEGRLRGCGCSHEQVRGSLEKVLLMEARAFPAGAGQLRVPPYPPAGQPSSLPPFLLHVLPFQSARMQAACLPFPSAPAAGWTDASTPSKRSGWPSARHAPLTATLASCARWPP